MTNQFFNNDTLAILVYALGVLSLVGIIAVLYTLFDGGERKK
jgi:hypothetical protein